MLADPHRIRRQRDFDIIHKRGRFFGGGFLSIKTYKTHFSYSRFAVLVSVKVSKRAVDRNKVKRQIKAVLQKQLPLIKDGFDVVFFTQKDILNKDFAEIEKKVVSLLKKARLYKK
jgi:ribonuclease P protein component